MLYPELQRGLTRLDMTCWILDIEFSYGIPPPRDGNYFRKKIFPRTKCPAARRPAFLAKRPRTDYSASTWLPQAGSDSPCIMKVCVDIQSAVSQHAGVGRYTHHLVRELARDAGDDELTLFCFDFKDKGTPFDGSGVNLKRVRRCPGRAAQFAWKTVGWPPFNRFAGNFDLYHFPNFFLPPLTRGKSVVTIHDMSFARFPEFAEAGNLKFLTKHLARTVERADAIITDSRFSADEICELLPVSRDRVFPIHLGISPSFQAPEPAAVSEVTQRLALDRPYLLTVGTVEPRKNIPFLIDLFEQLKDFDGDLVVAGMPGWHVDPILARMRESSCAGRIRYLDYVADADLPGLYAGARAFVTTSFYEGFGFPPLEAMACGTPVVSSNGGSLAEVVGPAAGVVTAFDVDAWLPVLRRALADDEYRDRVIPQGVEHARQFTWASTAAETWKVYRSL